MEPCLAQTPPITSSGLGTVVTQAGNEHAITGGTRPGNGTNLFHSFERFNIPSGNVANFVNDMSLPTTNLLGRVTGGEVSSIFGILRTTGFGEANVFLMNPAGVLFGPGARLDIGGSFTVTTADYVKLADTIRFNAVSGPQDALLSAAPIAAFGFLNESPTGVSIQDGQLFVEAGKTLSVVSGDVNIREGGALVAFNGFVDVASVASAGEVLVDSGRLDVSGFNRLGSITLTDSATITGTDVNRTGLGTIRIRGGRLVLDQSNVSAVTVGDIGAPPIAIEVQMIGEIALRNRSSIDARTQDGRGNAGDIIIRAGTLDLKQDSSIVTRSDFGQGAAGDVQIDVGRMTLTEGGLINSSAIGPAGSAGNVTINASESVTVSGKGTFGDSRITSSANSSPQDGGTITIASPTLILTSGGTLEAVTNGTARGGDIVVQTGSVTMSDDAQITARSAGTGNAGNIHLNAGSLFTMSNSSVTTEASLSSGGNISIHATELVRLVNSQINASVQGGPATTGGNIFIDPQFVILQNSQILAQAVQGQGGNITITTGQFLPDATSVVSASSQFGVSGTVTVQSPTSNLASTWARLQQNYQEAAALLRQRCAAQIGGHQSSFVVAGRERIPIEPGHWLASPLLTDVQADAVLGPADTAFLVRSGPESSPDRDTISIRRMPDNGRLLTGLAMDWDVGCES